MKKLIAIFFISGVAISCRGQKMDLKKRMDTLLPIDLNGYKIASRFSECGEWGGHKEEFLITASSKDSVFCTFKIYSINCDSAINSGSFLSERLAKDTTFILDDKKAFSLKAYFQGMLLSKLSYKFPSSSCNYYELSNSDSTLQIKFCDGKNSINNYLKLKKELGVLNFR